MIPGSAFGPGTNVVTCSVTDAGGNSNRCSFNVIVLPGNHAPAPVGIDYRQAIQMLRGEAGGTGQPSR